MSCVKEPNNKSDYLIVHFKIKMNNFKEEQFTTGEIFNFLFESEIYSWVWNQLSILKTCKNTPEENDNLVLNRSNSQK
jgi:hypothetical protein